MRNLIDLSGKIFENWTVLKRGKQRNGAYWLCKCVCGTIKEVHSATLRKNLSKSCGCMRAILVARGNRKHGATIDDSEYSYLYVTWLGIINRCTNPKHISYKNYGAIGIKMCDRWRSSFINFCLDVGHKPTMKHTLDRYPNKKGNYEPSNCRWATWKEQHNNRTNNTIIEINGSSKTVAEWSLISGIRQGTINNRLKSGWDLKQAVFTPSRRTHKTTTK